MKTPASKNNVEEKSRKILDIPQTSTSMHVRIHKHHYRCAHKHTDTRTHMYTHIYIHSQHIHVGKKMKIKKTVIKVSLCYESRVSLMEWKLNRKLGLERK